MVLGQFISEPVAEKLFCVGGRINFYFCSNIGKMIDA